MPRKLILIRHCKSSWEAFGQDDHARPLNDRGRRQAPMIGRWLAERGDLPDQVLCSDAVRTKETWALISASFDNLPPVEFSKALYLTPEFVMLEQLRKATGQTVAMLGHNPGIAEFAAGLVASPPKHERFDDYPTGATTILTFDVDHWADLHEGSGTVQGFAVPRDLEVDTAD